MVIKYINLASSRCAIGMDLRQDNDYICCFSKTVSLEQNRGGKTEYHPDRPQCMDVTSCKLLLMFLLYSF
jgi:hypothetical protein